MRVMSWLEYLCTKWYFSFVPAIGDSKKKQLRTVLSDTLRMKDCIRLIHRSLAVIR